MLYADFKRAFEARLQTRADAYVNAVEYYRVQFGQMIEYLLRSILEQTDNLIKLRSCVYRLGIDRNDDDLEAALAEVLAEEHTAAEVASVFKHFQRESPECM